MDRLEDGRAVQYARWCLEEKKRKVPRYVKLQAESWLRIASGEDPEAEVDGKRYRKICRLLRIMTHPDLGCSMYDGIEDYAWLLIAATLCTVERESAARFYETAVLEIARKNFKTFTSGAIFILLMLTEPMFSRFFSVAPDLKLSSELKLAIRKIIKSSPALTDCDAFKVLRSEIRCNLTESEYTPLAYSQDKMDGKLANAFLADEAGAMDNYPIDAMRSSQITLASKLGIIISTQYPNDNNAMLDEIDKSKKTLDGLLTNRRRFSLLYEPDTDLQTDDQWKTNDLVLYQANPVAVKNKLIFNALKERREDATLYENSRENFLCKHCNIRYKGLGAESFVDIQKVQRCSRPADDKWWSERRVYLGLDLSQTEDNTAVAMATMEDGRLYARVWGFIPSERIAAKSKKEAVDYSALIKDGCCIACGGEVINYAAVEELILSLQARLGVDVIQCGYDRYNAISTVQKLEAGGIECVEIRQHSSILHSPTKLLKEKILEQQFEYDANKMLEINFQNARCFRDTNNNQYVNKKRSAGKVDMVVALINATYLVEQNELYGGDTFVCQT